ncbi:hypothetical protein GCM10009740_15840 [Terrabacter terrae]|uniref:NADH:quinone oxidoreductase/Mrp antiporter transmembrane domain-containing protein n=1 Tax=Terrabacter terrae TaxID=318434 RepID=A0ABN2U3E2_9MICO
MSDASWMLWLLVGLPAAVGAVLAAIAGGRRPGRPPEVDTVVGPPAAREHDRTPARARTVDRAAGPVAVAVACVVVVLAFLGATSRPAVSAPFLGAVAGGELGLAVDGLAAVMVPTIAVVTLLVLVFSLGTADGELTGAVGAGRARFHGLMLLFAAAALLTATATTVPTLLLAWEVMGAMSWALIGFRWSEERRVSAGLTAFLTTRTADLGLYVAAGAAVAGGGGLALDRLAAVAPGWRDVVAAGIVVAALGKAAQLPFSFWLSRAMEGPSPVSALLHSATMVALGGFLLLRAQPLLAATGWAGALVAWLGAISAVVLGIVALAQRDLKQLLAASTAAQLAFVVLAAGTGSLIGGSAQLVAHAATKALLFLAAGVWLALLGTRRLDQLAGVARRWRVVGWSATLGALSLAGIAPLSLWATKDAVLASVLEDTRPRVPAAGLLYAVALVGAALSAAYSGKILAMLWSTRLPAGADPVRPEGDARPGAARTVPLVVLATGAVVLGALALPPLVSWFAGTVGASVPGVEWPSLIGAAVLSFAVTAVSVWVVRAGRLPEPGWARHWLGLEEAAHRLAVRPAFALARALDAADRRAVEPVPLAAATLARRAAQTLARFDVQVLAAAVSRAATGVRALAESARRPQTGQLHQYYVQAVVVATAAIALLVASALVR